jgi:hypothetical protein
MKGLTVCLVFATGFTVLAFGSTAVQAAGPQILEAWTTDVGGSSAHLYARIDAKGVSTTFHFVYIEATAYEANLSEGKEGFSGGGRVPPGAEGSAGSGVAEVERQIGGLKLETAYRYRAFAKSAGGSAVGPVQTFVTRGPGGPLQLLDNRGWEMVSPVDKNGGEIQGLGVNAGGGVLQAAAGGGAATFSSASSFGEGGQGAPSASQYMARRLPGGWSTENITAPLFSADGNEPNGVPYQLFSGDLARGLLAASAYPPLDGTEAPAGYQNYYLRDEEGFKAVLTHADIAGLLLAPEKFELHFAGASPDLRHVVLSSCAALTPDATEVPDGQGGCDPAAANLYEWSESGLDLINLLPGAGQGTPGAALAAKIGAVSINGSRVYWTAKGHLFLRDGQDTLEVAQGDGGTFQTASADGTVAFFTKGEHLYRYDASIEATADLTPAGGVQGVLGASDSGSHVYYLTGSGLFLDHGGLSAFVAPAADSGNTPPSTGTARVSADGTHLAFLASASLTGYDNTDQGSGKPDSEVYLYEAGAAGAAGTLICASCNPTGGRPRGPSTIPGAVANGEGPDATQAYKPHALSADGSRLFFDSADVLVIQDTNGGPDAYEWEAEGTDSCSRPGGCLQLISRGSGAVGASFVDASADGSDVLFLTDGSLVGSDPGSVDLYDARQNGGFPEPPPLIPCEEDACQGLPSPPDDPTPGTLVPSTGNPPVHFPKTQRKKPRHRKRHRCHARHRLGAKSHRGRAGQGRCR